MPMRSCRSLRAFSVLALLCAVSAAPALADWPMVRADARRSGYTAEPLPRAPALRWTYRPRHAPQPAWSGRDTRMPFDRAFHAVVAGETLFYGSSADCKVYALNVKTGAERWSFVTGGPVRFAPVIWRDRVFVVSDDGYLYCLASADGRLRWKLRGGPEESLILGNDRLISRWPARGGPVVADGTVYWAAGIWPSEGIYLYAVDAATGKVTWCNAESGAITMPQPHPGANAKSGVSAQGDLVVSGDTLLVPTGRGVPAAFRRIDGAFLHFHLQQFGHAGGSAVVACDRHYLNGGYLFDTETGLQGCRTGADPAAAVLAPTRLILAPKGRIIALDPASPTTSREGLVLGKKATVYSLAAPLWEMPAPHAVTALIGAGDALVAGGGGKVTVIDTRSRQVTFSAEVEGEPLGLAVSGGRLFVSTDRGVIQCFTGEATRTPSVIEPRPAAAPYAEDGIHARAAEEILRRTGVTEGYAFDLGCGDGALSYALATRTGLRICAVEPDPRQVALARRRLDAAGLYGVRVTVHEGDPAQSALPGPTANLVVSGRSTTEGPGALPDEEVQRLLRPYGGQACLGAPPAMRVTTRGDLPGAGTWTHLYSDPANTNCSADALVRGPLGVLWFTDLNFPMPSRHGRGPAPLFYKGTLLVEGMDGVRGVDAYNGRTLWEYPLPGILKVYDGEHLMGVSGTGSNLCVGEHGLFVRQGERCLRIDPANGKLLATFTAPEAPEGGPGKWGLVACVGDLLIGTLADTEHIVTYRFGRGDMGEQWTESRLLFAMDARTGAPRWRWQPKHSIRHNALAIGAGRVYLIDREPALFDRERETKVGTPNPGTSHPTGALVALGLADGREVWRSEEEIYGTTLALSEEHGILLMCYQAWRFKLASEIGGRMAAFDASAGARKWDIKTAYTGRPVINGRTIYLQPGAWDLLTGEKKEFQLTRSYGCGIPSGSRNLLLFRSATLGYIDLTDARGTENYGGIRPACWINAIPAGGLVLMPDGTDRCTCSYLIKASIALHRVTAGASPPERRPGPGSSGAGTASGTTVPPGGPSP